jgi:hypothetical protein
VVRLALSYSWSVSSDFNSSPKPCQPASLYVPVTGSGKIDRATGPNPENRASFCFSCGVAARFSCSMVFRVRMAVMMSRALVFSPLAIRPLGMAVTELGDFAESVIVEMTVGG